MIVSKWRDVCKAPVSSDLGWNVYLESLFPTIPCLTGGVGSTSEAGEVAMGFLLSLEDMEVLALLFLRCLFGHGRLFLKDPA